MIGNKKILAVTLARGGSKSIPKKNIVDLCGKPLLQYTADEVKKSRYIDKYIVSTDDEEIIKVCVSLKFDFHKRPEYLATDQSTSASALIDVVNTYLGYDFVVEVMCTNPLKKIIHIDECIEKLYKTQADSVVSVVRIYDHHPSRVKYIEKGKMVDFYPEISESRRQDLTPYAYVRNGSIYATTIKSLLKHNSRLGAETRPYIMDSKYSINIDEPIDLIVAESIIGRM